MTHGFKFLCGALTPDITIAVEDFRPITKFNLRYCVQLCCQCLSHSIRVFVDYAYFTVMDIARESFKAIYVPHGAYPELLITISH